MKKIIEFLDAHGCIDLSVYSWKETYPDFTYQEASDYFEKIYAEAGNWAKIKKLKLKDTCFPTYVIPFYVEKKEYRFVIMSGQGDVYFLFTVAACNAWVDRIRGIYQQSLKDVKPKNK